MAIGEDQVTVLEMILNFEEIVRRLKLLSAESSAKERQDAVADLKDRMEKLTRSLELLEIDDNETFTVDRNPRDEDGRAAPTMKVC